MRSKTDDKPIFYDLKTYLPETLLVKVDIASMANSLETRAPFLDYELAEMAFNIPFAIKDEERRDEVPAKKAGGASPSEGYHLSKEAGLRGAHRRVASRRPSKQPYGQSYQTGRTMAYQYIDHDYVMKLMDDYYSHNKPYGHRLWLVLSIRGLVREYTWPRHKI